MTLGIIGKKLKSKCRKNIPNQSLFLGCVWEYKSPQMTLTIGTVDFALKNNKNLMDPVRRKRNGKRKTRRNTKFHLFCNLITKREVLNFMNWNDRLINCIRKFLL